MTEIRFKKEQISSVEQQVIGEGFDRHAISLSAPPFEKRRINWLAYEDNGNLIGALTADLLWDWIYVDELWVHDGQRGQGLGRELMQQAEEYALSNGLVGIWLWTQSWQAEGFYKKLGFEEFARFDDFPTGHSRIGFRKRIVK